MSDFTVEYLLFKAQEQLDIVSEYLKDIKEKLEEKKQ